MGKIVPKLNLNRTPQQAENNSLIYAKNIRIGKDGNIYGDYPFDDIQGDVVNAVKNLSKVKSYLDYDWEIYFIKHLGHIVGLDDTIYLFLEINLMVADFEDSDWVECILQYNEITKTFTEVQCAWYWEGGEIDGCVTTNHTGESILTICEKSNTYKVPIKHINLAKCSFNDDPTIYTQAPNVPITNLFLVDTYPKIIPNGVYQFFIRYEIRKNFYTNWFACSKECFAGNSTKQDTIQGSVKYVDIRRDSDTSFVFNVDHVNDKALSNYKRFQLGFILSHDDEIVARTWKHFDLNSTTTIYFDYDKTVIEEIDISELLKDTYELYNVGNIDYFKNKLYISNYEESDKNPVIDNWSNFTIPELAENIKVTLIQQDLSVGENTVYIDGKELRANGSNIYIYWGSNNIKQLLNTNKYNNVTAVDTAKTSKAKTLIYKVQGILNWDQNPDMWWINKATIIRDSSTKTDNTELLLGEFDYGNYFWDTGFFTWGGPPYYSEGDIYENYGQHRYSYLYSMRQKWFARCTSNGGLEFGDGKCYNNDGSRDIDRIGSIVKNNLLTMLNDYAPKYQIRKISCNIDDSRKVVIYTRSDNDDDYKYKGLTIAESQMQSHVFRQIANNNVNLGLEYDNSNNKLYYKIYYNGRYETLREIEVSLAEYEYDVEYEDATQQDDRFINTFNCSATKKIFSRKYIVDVDSAYVSGTSQKDVQYNTLMPFTNYTFYIHYISAKGIITNGYKIGTYSLDNFDYTKNRSLIYPKFEDISIPNDYVGCFISISKPVESVCEGFGAIFTATSGTKGNLKLNCIESDALIYPLNNNVKVICAADQSITEGILGTYYPSGVIGNNTFNSFGNGGYIGINNIDKKNYDITKPHMFWIKVSSNITDDNTSLIKLTPYLSKDIMESTGDSDYSYDNYEALNSPGYLCVVYKPNIEQGYYVSGTDIYNKSFNNNQLKLDDNTNYINMINSTKQYIYSTCNLNYLSMSEDFVPSIRRYTSGSSSEKQVISALNSLTLSDCYKLESMYKEYTRKYFYPLDSNTITKFDNTIRSSRVIADEVFNNIYEFLPEDYYNVPANRGIITNLVAIADNIYIHTKHALYKFTGKNSLVGNEADIVTRETDVFDSGISEVFDSEIGYAGLDNKKESIVTFNAYIFYDKTANAIYAYEGQGGLTVISDPIKKLLDAIIGYNFAGKCNIVFGSDYKGDRIFINFYMKEKSYDKGAVPETTYTMIYNVCLSYNLVTKSFVSIHDFNFEYCIATRSNTYFIGNYYLGDGDPEPSYHICRINHFSFINHNNDYALDYQKLRESSIITFDGEGHSYDSVVEIICNINYETIKVLNYINWICSAVKTDSTNDLAINLGYNVPVYAYRGPKIYNNAEEPTNKYPGSTILVYTDQTKSKIVDLVRYENGKYVPNIQNDESLFTDDNKVNKKAYEYPRYNKGYWALNLFRDTVNNDNKYDSDNKSLIYGKYFVIRFTFYNTYFKLENVKLNMSNYE